MTRSDGAQLHAGRGKLICLFFLPLSPTWVLADLLKDYYDRARFLSVWRWTFFVLAVAAFLVLCFFGQPIRSFFSNHGWPLGACLWLIPFSRSNEIWRGFGADAFARLRGEPRRTPVEVPERIKLLMRSYGEVLLDFAIIYFLVPATWFKPNDAVRTILDALYFSGTTITTLGFGDIAPAHPISRLLALLEVFDGIVLVILVLAAYLEDSTQRNERTS